MAGRPKRRARLAREARQNRSQGSQQPPHTRKARRNVNSALFGSLEKIEVPLDKDGEGTLDLYIGPYSATQLLDAMGVPREPETRALWQEDIDELENERWLETSSYGSEMRGYAISTVSPGQYIVMMVWETA